MKIAFRQQKQDDKQQKQDEISFRQQKQDKFSNKKYIFLIFMWLLGYNLIVVFINF